MAEFLNQEKPKHDDGFANMGKPIPLFRRSAALEHAKEMGCNSSDAWAVVSSVSEQLERDKPYEAMKAGMIYLDLIGTYRLMAVLLTAQEKAVAPNSNATP